jgi:hypothetical protein
MSERMIAVVPEHWRAVVEFLMAPIAWIPRMQELILAFFLYSDTGWAAAGSISSSSFPSCSGWARCGARSFRSTRCRFGRTG